MQEVDLYPTLKDYLIKQGFTVKSEIQNCDVVAVRGDEPILVIELKVSLNLTVILQAVDRISITPLVYIGVPKGLPVLKKQRKRIVKLIRMLGLGLVVIDPLSPIGSVDVLCEPGEYRPRQTRKKTKRLLSEFTQRQGDPNLGGSSMQGGIITAYRQKAVAIAGYLDQHGETKAAHIAKALGEARARNILYDNVYGWFEGLGKGVYRLTPVGKSEFTDWVNRI